MDIRPLDSEVSGRQTVFCDVYQLVSLSPWNWDRYVLFIAFISTIGKHRKQLLPHPTPSTSQMNNKNAFSAHEYYLFHCFRSGSRKVSHLPIFSSIFQIAIFWINLLNLSFQNNFFIFSEALDYSRHHYNHCCIPRYVFIPLFFVWMTSAKGS